MSKINKKIQKIVITSFILKFNVRNYSKMERVVNFKFSLNYLILS